ncbi:MAG: Fis family transcriptional regulator [Planctomycetota bacterium]|nr:MAG: Fis family transcriptional regulator [Planctomycetota bacterium]
MSTPAANPLPKARILVVEDEPDIRESFCAILESEGLRTQGAGSLTEARLALDSFRPALVLLDLGLPDGTGLELLREIKSGDRANATEVVVITAETKIEVAVTAMREDAFDYLEKPIGLDRLLTTTRNCLERLALEQSNRNLREQAIERWSLIGESPAMCELRRQMERVAAAEIPVLITGENGTGKELVARGLHLRSPRFSQPFVATNCAAVPETLIEAEFFGHVQGAFTGADQARAGLFLEAGAGTLFLDEIGEMPLGLQARLLRVLQERVVSPVGSSEERQIQCRIVTATNKELEEEIQGSGFREDLYYRIRGVELRVPPLRERGDDVTRLARHFLEKHGELRAAGSPALRLGKDAPSFLLAQSWPGNVRQLESLMRAASLLVDEDELGAAELEPLMHPSTGQAAGEGSNDARWFAIEDLKEFRDRVEKEFLRRKLDEENWNVSATARRIGIRRTNLHDRLKHHGLK